MDNLAEPKWIVNILFEPMWIVHNLAEPMWIVNNLDELAVLVICIMITGEQLPIDVLKALL